MNQPVRFFFILGMVFVLCISNWFPTSISRAAVLQPESPAIQSPTLQESGLFFVENHGQFAAQVRFQTWGSTSEIWGLEQDGLSLGIVAPLQSSTQLSPSAPAWGGYSHCPSNTGYMHENGDSISTDASAQVSATIKLRFLDSNPDTQITAYQPSKTHFFYYIGDDSTKWVEDAPAWAGVRYLDLYPGIDLELSAPAGRITPHLIVHPGANLSAVKLQIDHAEPVAVSAENLEIDTNIGSVSLPLLSLVTAGSYIPIAPPSSAQIEGNIVHQPFTSQDTVAPENLADLETPANDPNDLIYSGYVGGVFSEEAYGLAVDDLGAAYVSGYTTSSVFFNPAGEELPQFDVFLAKIAPGGTGVDYVKFLGGSSNDCSSGVAVDEDYAVYLTGYTYSNNFPTTSGAFDRVKGGDYGFTDGFVVKLGTTMIYSTYLGGGWNDDATGIVLDAQKQAYVTGLTNSGDFPTTLNAYDRTHNALLDVYLVKLDQNGASLLYSTYLGGAEMDYGFGISMGTDGAITLTGQTESNDFPTTPGAFDQTFAYDGSLHDDCFVTRFSLDGSSLGFSTYLGDMEDDYCTGVDVHSDGTSYVTGTTRSPNFPATPGSYDTVMGIQADAFVARLDADGSDLVYATFLGGDSIDSGEAIAVAPSGAAFVSGAALSGFPTTPDAYDTSYNGPGGVYDAFITQISASGTQLVYSTFLGGTGSDLGLDLTLDNSGLVYVTGSTQSTSFPTKGSFGSTYQGGYHDAFISKLDAAAPSLTVTPPNGCRALQLTVQGTHWPAGNISIKFNSTTLVAELLVLGDGEFSSTIDVPADAAGGDHTITVTHLSVSGLQVSVPFRTLSDNIPIVFIHGVTGSQLIASELFDNWSAPDSDLFPEELGAMSPEYHFYFEGEPIWLDSNGVVEALSGSSRYFDALTMRADGATPEFSEVIPGDILWEVDIGVKSTNVYRGMREFLTKEMGYTEGVDFFPYIYDWRKDLSDTGWRLEAKINEALLTTGADRVVLLVHSMGGLVARNYLLNYGSEKVDQVISMGTPYLGSPKVTKVLEIGDNWGVGLDTQGWLGMHPMEFRKLSQNFPSAYALVPSAAWYSAYPFDPDFDPDYLFVSGNQKNYEQTRDFLRGRHNSGLLDAAVTFQTQKLGDWSVLTDQYVAQRIIGTDLDTIGELHYTPPHKICIFSHCISYGEDLVVETTMKGDGTVPVRSAMGVNLPAWDDRYYFIPNVAHTDLPQDSTVQALLKEMLQGDLCSRSQVTAKLENSSKFAEQPSPDQVSLTSAGTQILALGGAVLRVCNESKQCSTPRFFRQLESTTEIPGVSYETLGDGAMVFISNDSTNKPNAAIYTLMLQGTQPDGAAQVRISTLENGETYETLVFESIPITLTTAATVTLQTGELPETLAMQFKYDADSDERTVLTLGKLTGDTSQDLTPPTISLQYDNLTGKISLFAEDEAGGSGVQQILFSTQSETGEYFNYIKPLPLGTDADLWAIAMDNAFNVSASIHYPSRLYLPCIIN